MAADPSHELFIGVDVAGITAVPVAQGTAVVVTRSYPGREGHANEDAAAVLPVDGLRGVLAVADGMGGHADGQQASQHAVRHLARCVKQALDAGHDLRKGILDGFEAAHEAIRALGNGAATTLVVAELDETRVRTYHAGDSMALVCGQRGRLHHRTVPHSPVGYGVEAGLIAEHEALVHEDLHIVSNALGAPDMRIEMGPVVRLSPHDTVVLASDGLWDNLAADEIVEAVRKGRLERACEQLASAAAERMHESRTGQPGKPDDLTFVVWRRR